MDTRLPVVCPGNFFYYPMTLPKIKYSIVVNFTDYRMTVPWDNVMKSVPLWHPKYSKKRFVLSLVVRPLTAV